MRLTQSSPDGVLVSFFVHRHLLYTQCVYSITLFSNGNLQFPGAKKPAGIFQCPPVLFFYGNRMLAERAFYFYAIFTAMQCAAAINLSAELHIVVAGSGLPHFKHVNRVVVVCQPAFTSEVELTVFSLVQEY